MIAEEYIAGLVEPVYGDDLFHGYMVLQSYALDNSHSNARFGWVSLLDFAESGL